MARNVLSEMDLLIHEIIDVGARNLGGGEEIPYNKNTQIAFSRLLSYIRGGSWTDNDTAKFVAQNFHVGQSNLSEAWHEMYPSKQQKAETTMRTQYQKINKYLSNVLPNDLVDIFINEDRNKLKDLLYTIDALKLNDERVESSLGEHLIVELQSLPLSAKKYTVDECKKELEVIKRLSSANCRDMFSECDTSKLAYTYYILTKPSVIKGELNKQRLNFVKEFVNTKGTPATDMKIECCTDDIKTNSSGTNENTLGVSLIDREIEDYIEGVEIPSGSVVNPEVINYLHSVYTSAGIKNKLSEFDKSDVAYIINELKNDNEMFKKAIEDGIDIKEGKLGDYKVVPQVQDAIEKQIEGVSPSEEVSVYAVQFMHDYIMSTIEERMKMFSKEELARVYEDMISTSDNTTKNILKRIDSLDTDSYERCRGKALYEIKPIE